MLQQILPAVSDSSPNQDIWQANQLTLGGRRWGCDDGAMMGLDLTAIALC